LPANAQPAKSFEVASALLNSYATNDRINHYLVRNLAVEAWTMPPPGGKGRSISATFAHMHNVRLMWLKSAAKDAALPAKLEGETCAKEDAIRALDESWRALEIVLRASLSAGGAIGGFKPDAAGFLAYLLAHDAHHRGQIAMLARQVGHPVPQSVGYGLWEWGMR